MPVPTELGCTLWMESSTLVGYGDGDTIHIYPDSSGLGRDLITYGSQGLVDPLVLNLRGGMYVPDRLCGFASTRHGLQTPAFVSVHGFGYGYYSYEFYPPSGDTEYVWYSYPITDLIEKTGFTTYSVSNVWASFQGNRFAFDTVPYDPIWQTNQRFSGSSTFGIKETADGVMLLMSINGNEADRWVAKLLLPNTIPTTLGNADWPGVTHWMLAECHFDGTTLTITAEMPEHGFGPVSATATGGGEPLFDLNTTDPNPARVFIYGNNQETLGPSEQVCLITFNRALDTTERAAMLDYLRTFYSCIFGAVRRQRMYTTAIGVH